jgi:hypothetical protein
LGILSYQRTLAKPESWMLDRTLRVSSVNIVGPSYTILF